MTDPLLSTDPLAGLFLPKPEDRAQPAVFLTGTVVSISSGEIVTVSINGANVPVSVASTVAFADLAVGAQVAMLGVRIGGLATYMALGVIDTGALRNANHAGLRLVGRELWTYDNGNGKNWLRADHPGIKAISVEVQAGGGTGGGAGAASSGEHSSGGGGGAGGYASALIFRDRMEYSAAMVIPDTTGVPAAGATTGTTGGDCSFGTLVSATGGAGGASQASTTAAASGAGGNGGNGTAGEVLRGGNHGFPATGGASLTCSGNGGSSPFGSGGRHRNLLSAAQSLAGASGTGYGGGGSGGAASSTGAAQSGGAGSGGLIVVWLYG